MACCECWPATTKSVGKKEKTALAHCHGLIKEAIWCVRGSRLELLKHLYRTATTLLNPICFLGHIERFRHLMVTRELSIHPSIPDIRASIYFADRASRKDG